MECSTVILIWLEFIQFLAAFDSELAGLCDGDLSVHWADPPAPRGDTELFPISCSLQVVPDDERPEERGLSGCKLQQANKSVNNICFVTIFFFLTLEIVAQRLGKMCIARHAVGNVQPLRLFYIHKQFCNLEDFPTNFNLFSFLLSGY